MLSTLLEKGACPNSQPVVEDSPLMLAVENCLPECVQILLKSGAHTDHIGRTEQQLYSNVRNDHYKYGNSPLHLAVETGQVKLVEALLSSGANASRQDKQGRTALHLCLENRNINNRALANVTTGKGQTALHILFSERSSISEGSTIEIGMILLLQAGADPSVGNCLQNHYLEIDLSSFNQLIRCGSHLAPIENDDTENKFGEYCMSPDFSRRTSSLTLLIKNGLFTAAMSLVRCGWNVEKEKWIDSFDLSKLDVSMVQLKFENCKRIDVEKAKEDFSGTFSKLPKSTEPLSILCRNSIRKQMVFSSGGSEIETKIQALQLPKTIRSFLNLTECMPDEEIIMLIAQGHSIQQRPYRFRCFNLNPPM
ncbi:unnamed protein product [Mytilus edulis]|uniref:Uncharacterized protein n=1 Tax=Mytilus edulis TaxID=6550 RepID=A0A8S3TTX7_MYTED|nr:unnamed protein product [Mytilus edulis]